MTLCPQSPRQVAGPFFLRNFCLPRPALPRPQNSGEESFSASPTGSLRIDDKPGWMKGSARKSCFGLLSHFVALSLFDP